jgi:hypothetical protein
MKRNLIPYLKDIPDNLEFWTSLNGHKCLAASS